MSKFVTFNNISVNPEYFKEFESRFLGREKMLMPGCLTVKVLKPNMGNEYIIYSEWESEEIYQKWVTSEEFKKQHGKPTDRSIYSKPAYIESFMIIDENNEGY